MEIKPRQVRPPELYGDFWLNGDPVSLRAEQGNVVLLDFWDMTDPECLRGVQYTQQWFDRYRLSNLVVVGVHTAQFGFGKDPERVGDVVLRLGLRFPVVMDNEGMIWRSYENRVRPTRYLVDKDGFLRIMQEGTGGPDRFERAIQSLLRETGIRGWLPEPVEPAHVLDIPGVVSYPATADVGLGYLHGTPGNPEGYSPESTLDYVDSGIYLAGRFYVSGKWLQERELLRFEGGSGEVGSVAVRYEAAEVFAVLGGPERGVSVVEVTLDDAPLGPEICGQDVKVSGSGAAIVSVGMPRLYHLVRSKEFGEHVIRLKTSHAGVGLYSFSFVSSAVPEFLTRPSTIS